MKATDQPGPCPFCQKPAVGLACDGPECQRRIAKNRAEPEEPQGGMAGETWRLREQTADSVRRRGRLASEPDPGFDNVVRAMEDTL